NFGGKELCNPNHSHAQESRGAMFGGRVLQSRRGSAVPIGRAGEAYERRLHSQLSSCPRSACGRPARLQDHPEKKISICAPAFGAFRAGGLMTPTGRLKFSAAW